MQYKDRVQYIDEQTGCPHCQKEKGDALLLSQACEEKVKVFNVKDIHYLRGLRGLGKRSTPGTKRSYQKSLTTSSLPLWIRYYIRYDVKEEYIVYC